MGFGTSTQRDTIDKDALVVHSIRSIAPLSVSFHICDPLFVIGDAV